MAVLRHRISMAYLSKFQIVPPERSRSRVPATDSWDVVDATHSLTNMLEICSSYCCAGCLHTPNLIAVLMLLTPEHVAVA